MWPRRTIIGTAYRSHPLVKPVGLDQAPSTLHGVSIRRAGDDGLRLGVDGVERHLAILRPEGNQAPPHDG